MADTLIATSAGCPRCGYALRGIVESWRDACPLEGACSECGLVFDWADQLSPRRVGVGWCVEYARRWWTVPGRAVVTAAMSLAPWRFFSSLKMSHEPRWSRIAAYVLLATLVIYLPVIVDQGVRAWQAAPKAIAPGFGRNAPPTRMPSVVERIRFTTWAALLPLSTTPAAEATARNTTFPWQQYRPLISPRSLLTVRFTYLDRVDRRSVGRILAFPLAVAVLVPLGFVTVPVTRLQARVRWRHIVRIALYGSVFLLIPPLVLVVMLGLIERFRYLFVMVDYLALAALVVVPAMLFAWWGFAVSRHLKLPNPWGVTGALFAIAVLVPMCAGYFTFIMVNWGYVLVPHSN